MQGTQDWLDTWTAALCKDLHLWVSHALCTWQTLECAVLSLSQILTGCVKSCKFQGCKIACGSTSIALGA